MLIHPYVLMVVSAYVLMVVSCSVHQFFECFDDLRNSQSALGSSGMWNWTCSVFSAITAASNLASGSLLIPSGMFFGPTCTNTHHIYYPSFFLAENVLICLVISYFCCKNDSCKPLAVRTEYSRHSKSKCTQG